MTTVPPSTRTYRGTDAEARRADRRTRLIEAAIRRYGADGFARTGVQAVCREAGLTERYFYESFANSAALLAAAFEMAVTRLETWLEATNAASTAIADPEARLRRLIEAYYIALAADPAAARLFLVEIAGVGDETDRLFDTSLDRLTAPLMDLLDPHARGPAARDPLVRRGIAGALLQIALAWIQGGYARPAPEVATSALPFCRLALADRGHGG